MRKKWAVFISGRGSNMAALADLGSSFPLSVVVSSRVESAGVKRARRAGLPVLFFSKEDSWQDLTQSLKERGVNRIFLAGFMLILPESFIKDWAGSIWNIHPSLLPAYTGLNSMERAFMDRADMGISLHEVDGGVDTGPLVKQHLVVSADQVKAHVETYGEQALGIIQWAMHRAEHRLLQEVVPCL